MSLNQLSLQAIYESGIPVTEAQIAGSIKLVQQIQTRLQALRVYAGPVDGIYGKKTDDAIAQFCKSKYLNCPATNQYGRSFAKALIEAKEILSKDLLPIWNGGNKDQTVKAIIAECDRQGLTLPAQKAYVLATTEHETAGTWQPIDEYGGPQTRYAPYWGRGYVQLTWDYNYIKYSDLTGIDLYNHPGDAKRPDVALFVLVHGCKHGAFTGLSVVDYINDEGCDFRRARKVINGMDRCDDIAAIANDWQRAIA